MMTSLIRVLKMTRFPATSPPLTRPARCRRCLRRKDGRLLTLSTLSPSVDRRFTFRRRAPLEIPSWCCYGDVLNYIRPRHVHAKLSTISRTLNSFPQFTVNYNCVQIISEHTNYCYILYEYGTRYLLISYEAANLTQH